MMLLFFYDMSVQICHMLPESTRYVYKYTQSYNTCCYVLYCYKDEIRDTKQIATPRWVVPAVARPTLQQMALDYPKRGEETMTEYRSPRFT